MTMTPFSWAQQPVILLLSVGGSPDPILFSVQSLRSEHPEHPLEVVFVCSVDPCPMPSLEQVRGEGLPCRHTRADGTVEAGANLLVQLDITGFDRERHLVCLLYTSRRG